MNLSELYQVNEGYDGPSLGGAVLLFVGMVSIIVILSFYLTKAALGRNWESHRCDYIFLSGFLQPDKHINASDYTAQNLKYCIKQKIYNETPILPYVKDTLKKINYLIRYLKKKVGLYEDYVHDEVGTHTTKYHDIMTNKINYFKQKQRHLTSISNKIHQQFGEITNKISVGANHALTLEKEKAANARYVSQEFQNVAASK